jgi:hypothetical protein
VADYTYDVSKQFIKSLNGVWDSSSAINSEDHQTITVTSLLNPQILNYSFELWTQRELNLNSTFPEGDFIEGTDLYKIKDNVLYPTVTYPNTWNPNNVFKKKSQLVWTGCLYDNIQIATDIELMFIIDNTQSMNIIIDRVLERLYDIINKFTASGLSVAISVITVNDISTLNYSGQVSQWITKSVCPKTFDIYAVKKKLEEISKTVFSGGDILEPLYDGLYVALTECASVTSNIILFMMSDNEGKIGGILHPQQKSKYSYQQVKDLIINRGNVRFFFYGYNFDSGASKLYRGSYKPTDLNYPNGYESVSHSDCTYINELAALTGGNVNGNLDVIINNLVSMSDINFTYNVKEIPDKNVYILRALAETLDGQLYEYEISDLIVGDRTPPKPKKPLIRVV